MTAIITLALAMAAAIIACGQADITADKEKIASLTQAQEFEMKDNVDGEMKVKLNVVSAVVARPQTPTEAIQIEAHVIVKPNIADNGVKKLGMREKTVFDATDTFEVKYDGAKYKLAPSSAAVKYDNNTPENQRTVKHYRNFVSRKLLELAGLKN